jgi:hypothetical protein
MKRGGLLMLLAALAGWAAAVPALADDINADRPGIADGAVSSASGACKSKPACSASGETMAKRGNA